MIINRRAVLFARVLHPSIGFGAPPGGKPFKVKPRQEPPVVLSPKVAGKKTGASSRTAVANTQASKRLATGKAKETDFGPWALASPLEHPLFPGVMCWFPRLGHDKAKTVPVWLKLGLADQVTYKLGVGARLGVWQGLRTNVLLLQRQGVAPQEIVLSFVTLDGMAVLRRVASTGQARTHVRSHTHTHTHTHARAHGQTYARTHARTDKQTHGHTHTRTHGHTHTLTHARTHTACRPRGRSSCSRR